MKLLIIRHGDPDYEHDTLTEHGNIEAVLLAERLSSMEITEFYVSPLGRAQATAAHTLEKMNRTACTCDWLREFHAPIHDPNTGEERIPWDWLPAEWSIEPAYYDKNAWYTVPLYAQEHVYEEAKRVWDGLDDILAAHGYTRDGNLYRVECPNSDTLAFFCHFGVECVMLAHLLGISPMVLWHGSCAAPTSVTILSTEERRAGIASLRMNCFGDTSHLYAARIQPSFSGRFCERYDNLEERHD